MHIPQPPLDPIVPERRPFVIDRQEMQARGVQVKAICLAVHPVPTAPHLGSRSQRIAYNGYVTKMAKYREIH